ncbi:MAG: DUF1178 family protein [Kiloniellales bacterium]
MILYRLRCGKDHRFEGWFRDADGYDAQAAAGEIACPVCGDTATAKAPMAPQISASRQPPQPHPAVELRRGLLRLRRYVEQNCEHVGNRFAEEARKIHYGEIEKRDIYGAATDDEARELKDEGVAFGRIPWIEYQEH